MRVFLTGITGLLGHEVAQQLIAKGYSIRALVRTKVTSPLPNTEYVEGDILDVTCLHEHLKDIDYVIHAAATVSFAPKDRENMYKVNVEGTANVVNACLENKIKKLCHVSSIAAFGRPPLSKMRKMDKVEIDENQKWVSSETNSHYAISKYLGECEAWRGAAEGLDVVIVNPSIILGGGDWNQSSTQLFKYVYQEKPFYTAGYLNYVDVQDVAKAMIQLTESDIKDERFCLSAGMISYEEFFGKIAHRFKKKKPRIKVGPSVLGLIWRLEAIKSFLTGKAPLITKETAKTAQLKILQVNNKIKKQLDFTFTELDTSLDRICTELIEKK